MKQQQKTALLALAVIFLSCNLRAPFTGVGSLSGMIRESLGLSAGSVGLLTTIPLLAFAVVSPFVGTLCKKYGAGRTLLSSLLVLSCGILLRNTGGAGLFLGTAVVGIGIAVGNVLLPAIIKVYFPQKIGLMTGLYSTFLSVGASIASGVSVPLALAFGWQAALSVWLLLSVATFLLCLPNRRIEITAEGSPTAGGSRIYRSSMTWWITFYMGVQSFVFYCFSAWLAGIMQARGYDSATAGFFVSAYMLLGVPASFLVPILAGRRRKQSTLGVLTGLCYLCGAFLLFLCDGFAVQVVGVALCSMASGGSISFIIAMFSLRTTNGADASDLSGIAQSAGYLVAAVGPFLLGRLYDGTQSWNLPILLLLFCMACLTVSGWFVGRDRMIGETETH